MELFELIPPPWQPYLRNQNSLLAKISEGIESQSINPIKENIFRSLQLAPENVKVVILGQDPYPNVQHATGLAFSIPPGVSNWPPTLRNILKEYSTDLDFPTPRSGDLTPWLKEGVLLLNPIFTCRSGESLSHEGIGWELFTKSLLSVLDPSKIVGVMWGKQAQGYKGFFNPSMSISSAHPSPLSAYRGFLGSRPFSRANDRLIGAGISPVNWRL
jgi:uracil-DNA glycosylase